MARGLGKGFDSILPLDVDVSRLLGGVEIRNLALQDVIPNPKQPRRTILEEELTELADSIKAHGVLQPILVVKQGGQHVIVAGERRWRAAQQADLKFIPSIVREFDDLDQLHVALIENIQRVDLNPLEAAESIRRLNQDFDKTFDDIAESLGKSKAMVVNTYRLLKCPDFVIEALQNKEISEGHARCFLSISDYPDAQLELLKQIKANHWSVRRSERFVQDVKQNDGLNKKSMAKSDTTETKWTKKLAKRIDAKVEIKPKVGKGGYVKIVYKDSDHLQNIISTLE